MLALKGITQRFLVDEDFFSDLRYQNNGVGAYAKEAYLDAMNYLSKTDSPFLEDVCFIYTNIITSGRLDVFEFEDQKVYDDFCDEAYFFIEEYCRKNDLALRKRIYDDESLLVVGIYRPVTPQRSLFSERR